MAKNYHEFNKIVNESQESINELNRELESLYNKRVGALLDTKNRLSKNEINQIDNKIENIQEQIKEKQRTIDAAHSVIMQDVLKNR